MIIYSFDGVLRSGRVLHSIEVTPGGKRVALWRPVALMDVAYFSIVLALVALAAKVVPFVDALDYVFSTASGGSASAAAWACSYVIVPAGIVWLARNAEIDGRSPHRWVVSVASFPFRRKRTRCGRAARAEGQKVSYRGKLKISWDQDSPRLQHGWVEGGRITTTVPTRFSHSLLHRSFVVKGDEHGAELDGYEVKGKLEVKP